MSPLWSGKEAYVHEAERFCHRFVEMPREGQRRFPERGWGKLLLRVVARLHWERLFVFCFGYVQAPGVYWLPTSLERMALIDDVVSATNFDLIISELEGNAELIPIQVDVPKLITLHNTQSTLFKRARKMNKMNLEDWLFFWPELLKVMRYEKQNYPHYNMAVAVSEEDRQSCNNAVLIYRSS